MQRDTRLRHAGLATSAAEAGQNEREIMNQTRHKSEKMVRRYIRKGSLFQGNVVGDWGSEVDTGIGVLEQLNGKSG